MNAWQSTAILASLIGALLFMVGFKVGVWVGELGPKK